MIEYVGHAYAGVGRGDYQINLSVLTGGIGTAPQPGDLVVIVTAGHWESASTKGYDVGPFAAMGYNTLRQAFYSNTRALNFCAAWKAWDGNAVVDIHPGTNPGRGTNNDGSATVASVWRGVDLADPFAHLVEASFIGLPNIDPPPVDFALPGSHIMFLGGASAGSGGLMPSYVADMAYGAAMRGVGLGATALIGGMPNSGPVDLPQRYLGADNRTAWAAIGAVLRPAPAGSALEREAVIAATSAASGNRILARSRSAAVAANSAASTTRSIGRQLAASMAAASGVAASRFITRTRAAAVDAVSAAAGSRLINRNRSAAVESVSALMAKVGTAAVVQRDAAIAAVSGAGATSRRLLQRAAAIAAESGFTAARSITLSRAALVAVLSASTAYRALALRRVATINAVSGAIAVPIFGQVTRRYAFPGETRGGRLIHQPRGGSLIHKPRSGRLIRG